MLNPDAKLNPKMFDEDVEQKPTRDGYGTGLVLAGERDMNVVALCADLTDSTRVDAFSKKFPERYVEIGVAEQNMAAVAAGMAVTNKIPFIASYATFSPGRNWEQIRTTIAYNDANVKIAGHHAGISVGPDGATHQATEDIAIMRALPNMKVFVPCDAIEAEKATMAAAHIYGPVYLRFQREKTPIMTTPQTPYTPGKAEIFWQSKKPDIVLIACGGLVFKALLAARELEKEKIGAIVLNVHTIKPLDEKKIVELAKKTGAVVTIEEHQIQGGLGGAVAECLAKYEPTPIEFIGMQNTFGESGPPDKLIEKYGMDVDDIKRAAKKALRRK
jgi:transketolase